MPYGRRCCFAERGGLFFFFNDTATTEIYTLSLHDALPISALGPAGVVEPRHDRRGHRVTHAFVLDRKSTRLNSSHANISYAVFCLKKKKNDRLSRGSPCISTLQIRSSSIRRLEPCSPCPPR